MIEALVLITCFRERSSVENESEPIGTKGRILEAAGKVFAESGFRRATVREICRRAGVNIAAVNYHFRDKTGLYSATLRHWHGERFRKYPSDPATDPSQPPEKRLAAFIGQFLSRILDEGEGSLFGRLMAWEFIEPTEGLDLAVKEGIRPVFNILAGIIRELVGGDEPECVVRLCSASIVGQCLYFQHGRPIIRRLFPGEDSMFDKELIAGHIARFSINGVKAARAGAKGERP